jgi:hypothetical protein
MTGTTRNVTAEHAMRHCDGLMDRLRSAANNGDHDDAEHVSKLLSEHMSAARLPCDYQREILSAARHLHMQAAMKATELALERASARALARQTLEHAREMARARNCLGKAALLGAPRDFRQACEKRFAKIVLSSYRGMRPAAVEARATA